MKVVFLHPDLGIGGAERLVVDVALSMKKQGHSVLMVTSHHDRKHCFKETRDGTLDVIVTGSKLPRCLFGRFHAFFAYLRMIWAAFYVCSMSDFAPDLIFCDQVSCCIPVLRRMKAKIIFYCHFPDQLLTSRKNWLKRLYRWPLDWIEEKTTGMADVVLVNSEFTRGVFYDTFKSLNQVEVQILHPTVSDAILRYPVPDDETTNEKKTTVFLSLNRYERKKNISLAIHALAKLKSLITLEQYHLVHVIIAGGYDDRVKENREHFIELQDEAVQYNVSDKITFMKSPDDGEKRILYHTCTAVLYTPSNEHFGIVPIEAMFCSRPVIACNSGGPLETVIDKGTGFLCEPTPDAFADKMKCFVVDKSLSKKMGVAGVGHVKNNFAVGAFTTKVKNIVDKLC